ncbi:MAG: DUF302 domain-containing protein [Rhodoplanes sp.]
MSMRLAAVAVILSLFASSALAEKLVTIESKHSVKESLDRLTAALDQRGIKPVARVDHAAGAKTVGMELPPTEILIFGNPKLGTPLMQANPEVGIDLPMKVLAWQDKAGKVWVAYTAPDALKARYDIADRDEVFKAMAAALQALAKAASGQ